LSIKATFPNGHFRAPATSDEFAKAETELKANIPQILRDFYSETNGFREPIGNAAYLLPLLGDHSMVSLTKFFWNELPNINPRTPDFSEFIFFGNTSGAENWAIRVAPPHQAICYHHHMEDKFELAESDLLQLFSRDQEMYQSPE
jgi:hypothetical protein